MTGYSHAKELSWIPPSHHTKRTQNGSKRKTIKLLEGNTGENLHDLLTDKCFLDMTPKTQPTNKKTYKPDSTKI